MTVKAEEYDKLKRSAMLQELKEDLEKWGKARFGFTLAIVAVAGFFGIQAIGFFVISGILGSEIDDAKVSATRLKDLADRVTLESTTAIGAANVAANDASIALAKLNEQAASLEKRFAGIAAKADADSENVRGDARLEIAGLQEQIDTLAKNVDTAFVEVRRSLTDIDAIPIAELFTQQTAVRETFEREKSHPSKEGRG